MSVDRRLPILGVLLLVESAAGFTPWISAADFPRGYVEPPSWAYTTWSILAAILGIVIFLERRAVFAMAIFSLNAVELTGWVARLVAIHRMKALTVFLSFLVPGMMFMALGPPLLWGAARALRENPMDSRSCRLGRIGAGLTFAGIVCLLVQEAPYLLSIFRESRNPIDVSVGWHGPLVSLAQLVGRILLVWSSVEMLRRVREEAVGRVRMRRVDRLMCGWIALTGVGAAVTGLLDVPARLVAPNLWESALEVTLILVTAFSADRWCRARAEGVPA